MCSVADWMEIILVGSASFIALCVGFCVLWVIFKSAKGG